MGTDFTFRSSRIFGLLAFFSLFLFSFAPLFAKLSNNFIFFGVGYVLFLIFTLISNQGLKVNLNSLSLLYFAIFIWGFFLIILRFSVNGFDLNSLLIGWLYLALPLAGVLLMSSRSYRMFFEFLPYLALLHFAFAILVYDRFPGGAILPSLSEIMRDGVFAFRLSSVSGSISLSLLLSTAAIISLLNFTSAPSRFKLVLFCVLVSGCILTFQRSSIVALFLAVLFLSFSKLRKLKLSKRVLALESFLLFSLLVVFYFFLGEDLQSFAISRFNSILFYSSDVNAFSERASQWTNVVSNLENYPLGTGPGQVGQILRADSRPSGVLGIPDGDYFRLISEYSFFGMLFYIVAFRELLSGLYRFEAYEAMSKAVVLILVIALVQALGSSTLELYFSNTIVLAAVSYLHQERVGLK